MKKMFLSIASVFAVLGAIFAFSSTVEAGGGPYIDLTTSNGSWTITQGQNLTLTAQVYPVDAKITHLYFFVDNVLVRTCTASRSCSATITNPSVGTHDIFVYAVDSTNHYYYLNTPSYRKSFTVNASVQPTVTLTQTGTAYAETSGTSGVFLQAKARGQNLTRLVIHRLDDVKKQVVSSECVNQKTDCTIGWYPTFRANEVGNTYTYQAVVTDSAGHTVTASRIIVRVVAKQNTPAPTPSSLNPILGAVPSTLSVNQTATISGTATNGNGVWGVEVRALPSWSNTALRNRCILNGKPTTGSCSLNIGSFAGHSGQKVKVWVIYWDAKTGLGYSSEMRYITLQ